MNVKRCEVKVFNFEFIRFKNCISLELTIYAFEMRGFIVFW